MPTLALKHAARIDISRPRHDAPELFYGLVEGMENGGFLVRAFSRTVKATRAVSCLLDPVENDVVLVAGGADGGWILAVLERNGDKDATLSFEGTVRMRAPEGDIHLSASQAISMSSETVALSAANATAVIGSANLVAKVYKSCIDNAVSVVEKMHLFCANARQHLGRSYKRVDGHEVEHAASRLLRAESMSIVAKKTDIKSGDRVTVNAGRFNVN